MRLGAFDCRCLRQLCVDRDGIETCSAPGARGPRDPRGPHLGHQSAKQLTAVIANRGGGTIDATLRCPAPILSEVEWNCGLLLLLLLQSYCVSELTLVQLSRHDI